MKLSELYGMQVEKLNSRRRGYILQAFADGEKISHLICCDEKENEFCITAENIISLNQCLIYRNESKGIKNGGALRLGAPCCDERGKILGVTQDYVLSGLNLRCALIGGKRYAYSRIVAGDVVIVKDKASPDVSASLAARDMFIGAICNS
ncbi:MAG: hypothetical protein ACI4L9_07190 [Candidatus Coproplasma sp.]